MSSPILFHGPTARGAALLCARDVGRLIRDPVGDDGLKVEDARLLVSLSENSGVGDRPPVVIVGPLDRATPEASDALLKTLEDLAEGPLRIVLWADYLGGVSKTIQSRILPRWCSPGPGWKSPYQTASAESLYTAWQKGDVEKVLSVVYENQKDWVGLLQGFVELLAVRSPLQGVRVWGFVRPLMDGKGSHINLAMALTEGA